LGTLPGDVLSYAIGVNDYGQVVGQSCDADSNCSAFLWQDGEMWNLNGLVASESGLYMTEADDINNLGEIVGSMTQFSSGNTPAYLAVPIPSSPFAGILSPEAKPHAAPKVPVPHTAGKPTAHLRGRF
jgi:probable HAF family extracellular repeat protein